MANFVIPYTTPANYTYDNTKIDVDSGLAKLKDLTPTDETFFANYNTDINGSRGLGVLTGTAGGGASVSGGKLDLKGDTVKYVDYDAELNADSEQVGTIRFLLTPNYSGNPSTLKYFFTISSPQGAGTDNLIRLGQNTSGSIAIVVIDSTGGTIVNGSLGTWVPVSGTEYEFEFNYDITTGASRLFIDGVQKGSTIPNTGTRDSNIDFIRIGSDGAENPTTTSDFEIDNFQVFNTVQHTSNYTPEPAQENQYEDDSPTIYKTLGDSIANIEEWVNFIETLGGGNEGSLQYQLSEDASIWKYWNGSAWVAVTDTTTQIVPTAIATITGTLDSGDITSIQTLDANTYDVSEVMGSPGFLIEVIFTNVPQPPTQITSYDHYNGSMGHNVDFDIWNYNTLGWDNLGTVSEETAITQHNYSVTGTKSDYLSGSNEVKIRYNHTSSGNMNHDIMIDYVYLLLDATPSNTWYSNNEANLASVVNTNISNFPTDANKIYAKAFLISDGDQKVELDLNEIGYVINTAPTVYAGTNKNVVYNVNTTPFSDAIFSDAEGNIVKAEWKEAGGSYVEIPQGVYSTLLEAVQAFEYLPTHSGNKTLYLKATDLYDASNEDNLIVNVNQVNITIDIKDENSADLPNVTFDLGDGSGSSVKNSPFSFTATIGSWTSILSKNGFDDLSQVVVVSIATTSLSFTMTRAQRIDELEININAPVKYVLGDAFTLDCTINTDLTDYDIRCEITDSCGNCIKLATSGTGGSDSEIDIINFSTGQFIITVAEGLTTNFSNKAIIEIEIENPDGQKRTMWIQNIEFKDEQITWTDPST